MNPLFWLGLSILLVAASLTAVLVAAIPALQELARAARSAEKLFDTLSRELPPTLNAIRNTSLEITDLTDDVSEGVKSASQVVKQADQSLDSARKQAQNIQASTRSVLVGIKTAWRTFTRPKTNRHSNIECLPMNDQPRLTLREREILRQENRRTEQETYRNNNG
jgi:ABC-type transporter Mla subunit MlaD